MTRKPALEPVIRHHIPAVPDEKALAAARRTLLAHVPTTRPTPVACEEQTDAKRPA